MADNPASKPNDGSTPSDATGGVGAEKIDAKPILEIEEDVCPKCRNVLKPGEIVCVKCGFDLRTNAAHQPSVGVEHVDEVPVVDVAASAAAVPASSATSDVGAGGTIGSRAKKLWGSAVEHASASGPRKLQEEFSTPGRGGVQTLLIFAAALVITTMVIAGIDSPTGKFMPTAGRIVLTLYVTLLATGLGLAAVAVVARISDMRLGRPDLATARMLVAFSAFQAIRGIDVPGPALLVHLLMWAAGIAVYWGLVMLLFRKPRHIAGYVLASHFVLYLSLLGGMELSGWVNRAEAEAEKTRAAVQQP